MHTVLASHPCCTFCPSYPSQFVCPKINIKRFPPSSYHFLFHIPGYFPKHVVIKLCHSELLLCRPELVHFGTEQCALGLRSFYRRHTVLLMTFFDITIVRISKVLTECSSYVDSISVSVSWSSQLSFLSSWRALEIGEIHILSQSLLLISKTSEPSAIILLYNINWWVSTIENESVHCAVRTEYLNLTQAIIGLERRWWWQRRRWVNCHIIFIPLSLLLPRLCLFSSLL